MINSSKRYKKIKLTDKHKIERYTLVSDEDYDNLSKHAWYAKPHNKKNPYYYATRVYRGKMIYMHYEIMKKKKGYFIDHINRNSLDNRRENLRYVTPLESAKNRKLKKGQGVTGYTKKGNKWQAQAKGKYLGIYKTTDEAYNAYIKYIETN